MLLISGETVALSFKAGQKKILRRLLFLYIHLVNGFDRSPAHDGLDSFFSV